MILSVFAVGLIFTIMIQNCCMAAPTWWRYKVSECGINGTFGSSSYLARGCSGTTPSYSTMVGAQGKVNSFYVTHVDSSYNLNLVEGGWLWMGTESGAPMYFMVTIQNNAYYETLVDWFTPGSTHAYAVEYIGAGGYGQQWRYYVDSISKCVMSRTYVVDGWATVGGERYNCSGNAEFYDCRKKTTSGWSFWTSPNDCNYWGPYDVDTDNYYEYRRTGSASGNIRPI